MISNDEFLVTFNIFYFDINFTAGSLAIFFWKYAKNTFYHVVE